MAAARRVQILRGHSGIDGYAFCLAMDSLLSSPPSEDKYQQLQRTVRPVTYLMRRSTFRPTCQSPAAASHGVYSLGELVDMFHTHKASMSLDKIYALIGMSYDGCKQSSLTPNYNIPFQEVFGKLIRYLIPGQISVTTQNEGSSRNHQGRGAFHWLHRTDEPHHDWKSTTPGDAVVQPGPSALGFRLVCLSSSCTTKEV